MRHVPLFVFFRQGGGRKTRQSGGRSPTDLNFLAKIEDGAIGARRHPVAEREILLMTLALSRGIE